MTPEPEPIMLDLAEMSLSPTAALFEGQARAGIGISIFVVRTRPGGFVEIHVHPYWETFVLLEGCGRGRPPVRPTSCTPTG